MKSLLLELTQLPWIAALGWTLLHFLWQGAAVAMLLLIVQRLCRQRSPNVRYLAACGAMLLMAVIPVMTFERLRAAHVRDSFVPAEVRAAANPRMAKEKSQTSDATLTVVHVRAPLASSLPSRSQVLQQAVPWIALGWFLGVSLLSLRLVVGWSCLRGLRRHVTATIGVIWQERLAQLMRDLRVSRPVTLVESALVEVPTVIGWLRPMILLPATCLSGLSPEELETVIAHELAHIRRHDFLVNLLQTFVETVLFYHPAIWWVSRQMTQEREHCCDDLAVQVCGNRIAYARALAALEQIRSAPLSFGMAADGGSLLQRIQRLLGLAPAPNRFGWLLAAILAALLLGIGGWMGRNSLLAADSNNEVAGGRQARSPRLLFGIVENEDDPRLRTVRPIAPKLSESIESVSLKRAEDGRNEIHVQFTAKGAELLERVTEANIGRKLAITFNGKPLTTPIIRGKISGGRIVITGQFSDAEANALVAALNTGKPKPSRANPNAPIEPEIKTAPPETPNARSGDEKPIDRVFRLDPNNLRNNLDRAGLAPLAAGTNVNEALVEFLAREGLDFRKQETAIGFPEPIETKGLIFSDGYGVLYARTTLKEMDRLECAIVGLSAASSTNVVSTYIRDPINLGVEYQWNSPKVTFGYDPSFLNYFGQKGVDAVEEARANLRRVEVESSTGRQRIRAKLESIQVREVFYDGVPLVEIIKDLREESMKRDPDRRGVNFILNSQSELPATAETPRASLDINKIPIRISPPLQDVRLLDVIEAVCKVAQPPLKYSIEAYAVVISNEPLAAGTKDSHQQRDEIASGADGGQSTERTLNVDLDTILTNLEGAGFLSKNGTPGLGKALAAYLAKHGMDFLESEQAPKAVRKTFVLSESKGTLLVRGTPDELERLGQVIGELNSAPPHVKVEVKFVEMSREEAKALGFESFLGNRGTKGLVNGTKTITGLSAQLNPSTNRTITGLLSDPQFKDMKIQHGAITGVLTENQRQTVLKAMEHRGGIDILGSPKVTTHSGRQARVDMTSFQEAVAFPSESTPNDSVKPPREIRPVEMREIRVGPQMDLLPTVSKDQNSVELVVVGSFVEFLGYDDPGPFGAEPTLVEGNRTEGYRIISSPGPAVPLPRFRLRQASGTITVPDGHTVVLSGMPREDVVRFASKVPVLGDVPLLGRFFRSQSISKVQKELVIFVTPTIVDPAGNRLNTPK